MYGQTKPNTHLESESGEWQKANQKLYHLPVTASPLTALPVPLFFSHESTQLLVLDICSSCEERWSSFVTHPGRRQFTFTLCLPTLAPGYCDAFLPTPSPPPILFRYIHLLQEVSYSETIVQKVICWEDIFKHCWYPCESMYVRERGRSCVCYKDALCWYRVEIWSMTRSSNEPNL